MADPCQKPFGGKNAPLGKDLRRELLLRFIAGLELLKEEIERVGIPALQVGQRGGACFRGFRRGALKGVPDARRVAPRFFRFVERFPYNLIGSLADDRVVPERNQLVFPQPVDHGGVGFRFTGRFQPFLRQEFGKIRPSDA